MPGSILLNAGFTPALFFLQQFSKLNPLLVCKIQRKQTYKDK